MCRVLRCLICGQYRVSDLGCVNPDHKHEVIARIEVAQRCRCREKQMAELDATAEAQAQARREQVA